MRFWERRRDRCFFVAVMTSTVLVVRSSCRQVAELSLIVTVVRLRGVYYRYIKDLDIFERYDDVHPESVEEDIHRQPV